MSKLWAKAQWELFWDTVYNIRREEENKLIQTFMLFPTDKSSHSALYVTCYVKRYSEYTDCMTIPYH